jgi:hypothetical protein
MKQDRRARRLSPTEARREEDRDRWKCRTCSSPADEDGDYCRSCRDYWENDAWRFAQ